MGWVELAQCNRGREWKKLIGVWLRDRLEQEKQGTWQRTHTHTKHDSQRVETFQQAQRARRESIKADTYV